MTDETITGKIVAMQPEFGQIDLRVALEGGIDNPEDAINSLGWDVQSLYAAVRSHHDLLETFHGLTSADVPPPRDEVGHEHVLVFADILVSSASISPQLRDEEDFDTEFLGKELAGVEEK